MEVREAALWEHEGRGNYFRFKREQNPSGGGEASPPGALRVAGTRLLGSLWEAALDHRLGAEAPEGRFGDMQAAQPQGECAESRLRPYSSMVLGRCRETPKDRD